MFAMVPPYWQVPSAAGESLPHGEAGIGDVIGVLPLLLAAGQPVSAGH